MIKYDFDSPDQRVSYKLQPLFFQKAVQRHLVAVLQNVARVLAWVNILYLLQHLHEIIG